MTSDTRVLVLIGAGSAVFTRGLLADLIGAEGLGAWEIRLVDVDTENLNIAADLAEQMVAARGAGGTIRVTRSTDRRAVLPGADFIVTCVGVGGRPAWQLDHEIVQKHGIYQPVGDSIMPGGISRLLRTTPVLVEIAQDIAELALDVVHAVAEAHHVEARLLVDRLHIGGHRVGVVEEERVGRELGDVLGDLDEHRSRAQEP